MTLNIPTQYTDVTIRQMQEAEAVLKDTTLTPLQSAVKMLAVMCKVDEDVIKTVDINDIRKAYRLLDFLEVEPDVDRYPTEFVIDGITYVGELRAHKKITAGLHSDLEKTPKDFGHLHTLMAILYRPKGEAYNSETVAARAEIFRDRITYDQVHGLLNYFLMKDVAIGALIQQTLAAETDKQLHAMNKMLPKSKRLNLKAMERLNETN